MQFSPVAVHVRKEVEKVKRQGRDRVRVFFHVEGVNGETKDEIASEFALVLIHGRFCKGAVLA